jgi:hypothetical protein
METPLNIFRDEYLDLLLGFLWREWTALGVAGQDASPVKHVIDPEALVLFTCSLGRYDPRLFDEVLDWLVLNERFLNVQRMRNVLRSESFQGGQVLSAMADWLLQREGAMKWKSLADKTPPASGKEALFFLKTGRALPGSREQDVSFLAHGFSRNPVIPRGYSRTFPNNTISGFFLKMRALFGVNARCDVLTYLALNRSGHPREIARELYYSQKGIHDVMGDLECSGAVYSAKQGRKRTFRLSPSVLPLPVDQPDMPGWINWPQLLAAAETVWWKVEELCQTNLDPLLENSEITLCMRPLLEKLMHAPWTPSLPPPKNLQDLALLESFRDLLRSML